MGNGGESSSLSLVDVFAVVAALRDQRVQDKRSLGEGQGVDVLELAQVEVGRGLLVAWRRRLGARGSGMVGHCGRGTSGFLFGGRGRRFERRAATRGGGSGDARW